MNKVAAEFEASDIVVARNDQLNELETAADQSLKEEEEELHSTFLNEKREEEKRFKALFVDKSGKSFDPSSKFGVIEGEDKLLYDNITTSYKINLPA